MAKQKPDYLVTIHTYQGTTCAACETEGQARFLARLLSAAASVEMLTIC